MLQKCFPRGLSEKTWARRRLPVRVIFGARARTITQTSKESQLCILHLEIKRSLCFTRPANWHKKDTPAASD